MRQDNRFILPLPCSLLALHCSSISVRIMTSRRRGVLFCVIESASNDIREPVVPYSEPQNVRFYKNLLKLGHPVR